MHLQGVGKGRSLLQLCHFFFFFFALKDSGVLLFEFFKRLSTCHLFCFLCRVWQVGCMAGERDTSLVWRWICKIPNVH